MAARVGQQEILVDVDFHGWALQEADDTLIPERYPSGRSTAEDQIMTLREGRLDMVSAAHTHTAHLSAEVWDGEPPVEDGERWEAREEGEIFSPTGRLAVCVTTTKQLDRIALGRPGVRWKARLYCTGRDEARQQEKVEFPDGVERYLVQFWPFL